MNLILAIAALCSTASLQAQRECQNEISQCMFDTSRQKDLNNETLIFMCIADLKVKDTK